MSLLYSDVHEFCFVHIPKNGGSTIRNQLWNHDEAEKRYHFSTPVASPYGPVQISHAPLRVIAELHPEDLERVRHHFSFAVFRDPADRFLSAFAQRCRTYLGKEIADFSATERNAEIDTVIRHLQDNPDLPAPDFCHFIRQVDFVYLDGERLLDRLYRLDRMEDAMADLSARLGLEDMTAVHSNRTDMPRFGGATAVRQGWQRLKPLLPAGLATRIGQAVRPMFFDTKGSGAVANARDPAVLDFVHEYYAADYDLLDETWPQPN